jgi:hypothetical protein
MTTQTFGHNQLGFPRKVSEEYAQLLSDVVVL